MPYPSRTRGRLPEQVNYVDQGCELYAECLSCPFPDCLHQGQRDTLRFAHSQRLIAVANLLARKLSVPDISHQTGLSIRHVFRLKRELTHSR